MLPSNNNNMNGSGNTIIHDNPTLLYHNDQLFSNIYNFPSSPPPYNFFDTNLINEEEELLLQQYLDLPLMIPTIEDKEAGATNLNMVDYSNKNNSTKDSPQKKRASKKDRHSKITTAQGPRDRRMRLSLEIAREFFGLQDKLGYDKASKTVEWLLIKAKLEIKKLDSKSKNVDGHDLSQMVDSSSNAIGDKSTSSISECEVISNPSSKCVRKERVRANKEVRKPVFLARETREKARARARERTKNKTICAKLKPFIFGEDATTNYNQDSNQLVGSSWSPPMSLEVDDDHSLVQMDKWSPISSIFNHQQGDHTQISHQIEFEDFHFDRKTWESYNFQSLQ